MSHAVWCIAEFATSIISLQCMVSREGEANHFQKTDQRVLDPESNSGLIRITRSQAIFLWPLTPTWFKVNNTNSKSHIGGLLEPQNQWKRTCSEILGTRFLQKKSPCGRTLNPKGLVKWNEIIQHHKIESFDSLKPFSESYSTILDDSYSKIKRTATRSQWEGSHKHKFD